MRPAYLCPPGTGLCPAGAIITLHLHQDELNLQAAGPTISVRHGHQFPDNIADICWQPSSTMIMLACLPGQLGDGHSPVASEPERRIKETWLAVACSPQPCSEGLR